MRCLLIRRDSLNTIGYVMLLYHFEVIMYLILYFVVQVWKDMMEYHKV